MRCCHLLPPSETYVSLLSNLVAVANVVVLLLRGSWLCVACIVTVPVYTSYVPGNLVISLPECKLMLGSSGGSVI